ncbi:cytidine deaminase [soil metagenome]
MSDTDIDWESLRSAARRVASMAYAPYSKLSVGAAALADDGRIVTGCNVENASYGLTLCAECGLVSNLHSSGGGRLVAVSVVAGDGEQIAPCGRCRQLLLEHGGPECSLDAPGGITTIGEILPGAFDSDELEGRKRST